METGDKILSVIIILGCFAVASLLLSTCRAYASELPCQREAVRAEKVCKKYGEDSVTCANARRSYERCMERRDPLDGIS
jgi:hypothetical protein